MIEEMKNLNVEYHDLDEEGKQKFINELKVLIQQMNHTFSWIGHSEAYNPIAVGRRIEKLYNDFTKLRQMLFEVFKRNGE